MQRPVPTAVVRALRPLRLLACAPWLLAASLSAQPVGASGGDFSVPFSEQGRQTAMLTGKGWKILPDGTMLLQTARVENHDRGGNTNANVIVFATNCIADLKQNVVWSADGLGLRTADGQFALAGVGFTWSQARNELTVSNQVRTEVRKPATATAEAMPLAIRSDAFQFNYASNLVTFRGRVLAEDPELEVRSERLTVRRSATGKFDHLLAEDAVRITRRLDGSVTSSDRAEYRLGEEGEALEFTGRPHWQDAEREARAERFVWRRTPQAEPHFLRAIGEAWIRLPAGTNSLAVWPLAAPLPATVSGPSEGARPPGPAEKTGTPEPAVGPGSDAKFLELSAGLITLALPATNGAVVGLVAETNVVLKALADGWQATARLATLTNGVLELSGAPAWVQGDRAVRGELLWLDTRDRSFAVRGQAQLRLPASAFGAAVPTLGGTNAVTPVFRTNQFVQVESAEAEFRDGWLRFAPPVRAQWFEDELRLGLLECRDLAVRYGDRLERVSAGGEVRLDQFGRPGRRPLERRIECSRLDLEFDAGGRVRRLAATGDVRGRQEERLKNVPEPRLTHVRADRVEAAFLSHTNQLDFAVAEGRVRLEREKMAAEGERAEFSGGNGRLALTGQPVVTSPEGRIRDATVLIWDSRSGRVSGQGRYRIEWLQPPQGVSR